MTEVWDEKGRARASKELIREAKNVIRRLNLKGVVVIGFWPAEDADHVHMIDVSVGVPMDPTQLYKHILTGYEVMAESGGKDVKIQ